MKINLESFYTFKDLLNHYPLSERTLRRYLKSPQCKISAISIEKGRKKIYSGFSIALNDGTLQYLTMNKSMVNSDEDRPSYRRWEFYTIDEVSAILGISKKSVRKLIEDGRLGSLRTDCRKDKYLTYGLDIAKFSNTENIILPYYSEDDK